MFHLFFFIIDEIHLYLYYHMFLLVSILYISILENTVIQTDYQFQDPLITPTKQLPEIQQILAQINDI